MRVIVLSNFYRVCANEMCAWLSELCIRVSEKEREREKASEKERVRERMLHSLYRTKRNRS